MKIAQVSTGWLSTPPKRYGGTERVVNTLTEELVRRGHQVTLFATGDSATKANLKWVYPEGNGIIGDPLTSLVHTTFAYRHADEFDVIHNHQGPVGVSLANFIKTPVLTTDLDATHFVKSSNLLQPDTIPSSQFMNGHFAAISKNQMKRFGALDILGVVHNAINVSKYDVEDEKEEYLLHMCNISPEKGTDLAIQVARKLGMKLIIAGKIHPENISYFQEQVKRYVDGETVIFEGEVDNERQHELLRNARCFLFPIRWEEPFGMVMIEAMACGTPVVVFNRGSAPEVVVDGETGFIVNSFEELLEAVKKVDEISPRICRQHVEKNFSSERMADGYETLYERMLEIESKTVLEYHP